MSFCRADTGQRPASFTLTQVILRNTCARGVVQAKDYFTKKRASK